MSRAHRFTSDQFTETPYATAEDKAKAATALARFIASGFKQSQFTQRIYSALNLYMFGHIAEFSIHGFYGSWFSTPARRASWVEYALKGGAYGFHSEHRTDLWGDVERAIVNWLRDSGLAEQIIADGALSIETHERRLLAELKAKYEDQS